MDDTKEALAILAQAQLDILNHLEGSSAPDLSETRRQLDRVVNGTRTSSIDLLPSFKNRGTKL